MPCSNLVATISDLLFSFFVEKMQQQKSIFVLCILSSKLICLFCNIFSGCQIRIGWCVCAPQPESYALACVLLIQCFPLVINASICHFKINWCGFHIIYAFMSLAQHTFFWFCPKVLAPRSLLCSLAHLFLTILCLCHDTAMLCNKYASLLNSVTFTYGYRW